MNADSVQDGRICHIRDICIRAMEFDEGKAGSGALTDRAWLAQSVLNILHGMIDEQIKQEMTAGRLP